LGETFTVKIGDKTCEVKLKRDKESKTSLSIILDGKEYRIEALKVSRREPFTIKVDDVDFRVQLPERRMVYTGIAVPTAATPARTTRAPVEVVEGVVNAPYWKDSFS